MTDKKANLVEEIAYSMATEKKNAWMADIAQVMIADEVNIGKCSAMKELIIRGNVLRDYIHRTSSVSWVDTKLAHSSRYISRI